MACYRDYLIRADRLCFRYIVEALDDLGLALVPGRCSGIPAMVRRAGVLPRHERLFARLVEILEEEGVAVRRGSRLEIRCRPPVTPSSRLMEDMLEWHRSCSAELELLGRCGPVLAQVLRGKADPLEVIFSGGSLSSLHDYYATSEPSRVLNPLVRDSVVSAWNEKAEGERFRILEIGAGTGAVAETILPAIRQGRVDYTFTDVSRVFRSRASQRFSRYRFVEYRSLNVERDPRAQGFGDGRFDVVVAGNVLHATRCLRESLRHTRRMLRPGGVLILREGTQKQRRSDLIFGLLEGWWRFADVDVRPSYPLLPASSWSLLLQEEGFGPVAVLPEDKEARESLGGQVLFVAAVDRADCAVSFTTSRTDDHV